MKKIKNIVIFIAFCLAIIVFLLNVIYIADVYHGWEEKVTISYFGILNLIVTLVILTVIVLLTCFLDKKMKQGKIKISKKQKIIILCILFIIYVIIEVIWICYRNSAPIADSMSVYEAAMQLFRGEDIFNPYYFEYNPQNLTLAYIFAGVFKLLHSSNVVILKIVNAIANCFTILGLYFITKQLKKDYKINMPLFILLAFTYIPIILLVNFTYGDLIGLAFVIFGIYFAMQYVNKRKVKYIAISSILMMIAVILRMNNLIFVIAITIYLLLNLLEKKRTESENLSFKKQLILKLVCILAFIIISVCPSNILKNMLGNLYHLDLNKEFLATRYIDMGMQEGMRANGWYNTTGDLGFEDNVPSSTYEGMIKERLTEFSQDIIYTIKFYTKKIISMWAEPLQESIWQNLSFNFGLYHGEEEKDANQLEEWKKGDEQLLKSEKSVQLYQKSLLLIIFGGTLYFIIKQRKYISNEALLLLICFIGGFMFHILWEGKSRYIIPYIVILIPVACTSWDKYRKIKRQNKKENPNDENNLRSKNETKIRREING